MPTYLTASVSQSVNQSVVRVYLTIPDYPFVPACLPACLSVCLLTSFLKVHLIT